MRLFLLSVIVFLGLSGLLFASVPFSVSAQAPDDGLRLITSPLPISLIAEPGSTITTDLKIKNGGIQEEKLKIGIMKFKAYEDSGKPALMEPEPGDDFVDWVTFSEPEFTLGSNEWKTITATFTVPESASFGYYYAFVFSRVAEQAPGERETVVAGGTAVLVLLEARVPNALREVTVKEFSTKRGFYEFLPATFHVALENTGNVHIAPRGNIFITQNGKEAALLEVNFEKGNILPNSTRTFDTLWNDGFPLYEGKMEDGKMIQDVEGNIVQKLTWDWSQASKLRFGKYTAKMLLIYDDGQHDVPIEGVVSFWVIPWRLLIALGVILLFFGIGLRSTFVGIWRKFFPKKSLV